MPDAPLTVVLQPKGLLHRFIRSKDTSTVVERPERLRAVAVGVAAAAARLEEHQRRALGVDVEDETDILPTTDSLADALSRLDISPSLSDQLVDKRATVFNIVTASSSTKLDIFNRDAVRFIHGEAHEYLAKLDAWASSSEEKIRAGESEIPTGYSQGDLYLCPQSIEAIVGSIAAVCQAVDISFDRDANASDIAINSTSNGDLAAPSGASEQELANAAWSPAVKHESIDATRVPLPPSPVLPANPLPTNTRRVFAAIRPPGHHCSDEIPSGFCFVNNVMIAAAHAHARYGVRRIIVLDFDLHHGNGTQSIAWSINAETRRQEEESVACAEAGLPPPKVGPNVYYGSLHDILSFPCEDGDANLVQAASTTLSGAHGQYIENVHLEPYSSEEEFFARLYPTYYERLLGGATRFLKQTGGLSSSSHETMVFVSAGFDASPHEHSYMSRHNRNVPTAFYTRFAQDVVNFAEKYAQGRIISVLEGGYSDWALMSASGAYLCGLAAPSEASDIIRQDWWESDNLELLQRLTKPISRGTKPRAPRNSAGMELCWFRRTREIIETLVDRELFEALPPLPTLRATRQQANTNPSQPAATKMTLRDRKKDAGAVSSAPQSPPKTRQVRTPPRTPQSSPPKFQRASAPRRKAIEPGTQTITSSETPQSGEPNSRAGPPPHRFAEDDESVPPVARFPKSASEGRMSPIPVDNIAGSPASGPQPPLMIRIKLPSRTKSSEASATTNASPLVPVTDP